MATKGKTAVYSSREMKTQMVKESLEMAFNELYAGNARKNARQLIKEIENKKEK